MLGNRYEIWVSDLWWCQIWAWVRLLSTGGLRRLSGGDVLRAFMLCLEPKYSGWLRATLLLMSLLSPVVLCLSWVGQLRQYRVGGLNDRGGCLVEGERRAQKQSPSIQREWVNVSSFMLSSIYKVPRSGAWSIGLLGLFVVLWHLPNLVEVGCWQIFTQFSWAMP